MLACAGSARARRTPVRMKVEAYNEEAGPAAADAERVIAYVGQAVLDEGEVL